MKDRDFGCQKLSNGVTMLWRAPDEEIEFPPGSTVGEGKYETPVKKLIIPNGIPEGHFALEINGTKVFFDTDEFKKWLRWA